MRTNQYRAGCLRRSTGPCAGHGGRNGETGRDASANGGVPREAIGDARYVQERAAGSRGRYRRRAGGLAPRRVRSPRDELGAATLAADAPHLRLRAGRSRADSRNREYTRRCKHRVTRLHVLKFNPALCGLHPEAMVISG